MIANGMWNFLRQKQKFLPKWVGVHVQINRWLSNAGLPSDKRLATQVIIIFRCVLFFSISSEDKSWAVASKRHAVWHNKFIDLKCRIQTFLKNVPIYFCFFEKMVRIKWMVPFLAATKTCRVYWLVNVVAAISSERVHRTIPQAYSFSVC